MTSSEIYFFNQNTVLNGEMNLDYTQLNANTPYKTSNNIFNLILKNEEGNFSGKLYANKILQKNSLINIENATNTYTLDTDNGILMFLLAPNYNYLPPGYISGTKPIFASKNYLGKNIEIIIDVLNDELQTRRLSVIFL